MTRSCPYCHTPSQNISSFGSFVRISDKKKLRRFRCQSCLKTFSQATFQQCYRQKKRRLNPRIRESLASGVSQRRIARLLKISRTTVGRKLKFLGLQAKYSNWTELARSPQISSMQFDDLETFEHTKCKPVSVTLAVEAKTRKILGFRVSCMPAKGHLAKKARKRYGYRPDHRKKSRENLFSILSCKLTAKAEIVSDESPHYPASVRKYFQTATHIQVKGQRGAITGQGELKKIGFDPLFSLNHTFAMLRANINRLFRKTWCTTKDLRRLEDHIEIYVQYHNQVLLNK